MLWNVEPRSSRGLAEQIAANVRRAVAGRELSDGDRLPTAADLGRSVGVNPNTVLAAYRQLREEGLVEFRRGRGVRVRVADPDRQPVVEAARRLVEIGVAHGYTGGELAAMVSGLWPTGAGGSG
jgi:DNA-binding transcriptional regulator YhcF (GntR family)